MRAMPPTGHGDVTALAYRTDIPVADPGPGEVLVRLRSATVNNTDINPRTDWHSKADAEPTGPSRVGESTAADAGRTWRGRLR